MGLRPIRLRVLAVTLRAALADVTGTTITRLRWARDIQGCTTWSLPARSTFYLHSRAKAMLNTTRTVILAFGWAPSCSGSLPRQIRTLEGYRQVQYVPLSGQRCNGCPG